MTHRNAKIRPAMAAIAAVLAFSSTSLLAQSVDAPTTPAPVVVTPSPVVVTPPPVAAEPLAAQPTVVDTAVDPVAAETVAKPAPRKTIVTKTATVRSRPATARVATAAPLARAPVVAPVAAPVAAPAETVAAPVPVAATPAAPAPAVAVTPPARNAPAPLNPLLPIAGAAGLILLGLIAFVAMRRRKRRNEEEIAAAEYYESELEAPAEIDPIFAEQPSAQIPAELAPAATVAASGSAGSPSDCAEAAPGSHVEAACDGPSADNPSLSIKKRLKRAHFFDQREQLAAAGLAVPVETDAGLPDALTEPASSDQGTATTDERTRELT
jgi:hypothetical protein